MSSQKDIALEPATRSHKSIRRLAVVFLIVQGVGVAIWWGALLFFPAARGPFVAPGAPDPTLLAFVVSDMALYVGGSFVSAYGLARGRAWAWPILCVHAGAVAYAGLYSLALPLVSGGGWLGAGLMLPSLVIAPSLAWRLRPGASV